MIIAYKLKREIPLVKLGIECQKFGGYILKNKELEGLYYKPFIKFINEKFGLDGEILSHVSVSDIIMNLEEGNFVIASVSHEIRNPKEKPLKKGGHLVLVLGYDMTTKYLFIHNPSGIDKKSQEYAEIGFSDFEKFFANRGISID